MIIETCPQPEPVQAIENEAVTLNCMLEGNPRPMVAWTFENATIRAGGRYSFSNRRAELTIMVVVLEDAGLYTCTATNRVGRDMYEFLLEVQGPAPSLFPLSPITHTLSLLFSEASSRAFFRHQPPVRTNNIAGEAARLLCEAGGIPTPAISWFKTPLEADTPVTQVVNLLVCQLPDSLVTTI